MDITNRRAKRSSDVSPIGRSFDEVNREHAEQDPTYRRIREQRAPYQEIAWLLIRYRMEYGLTQEELAKRVGTSHSQIARVESGRHATSLTTLIRIAHALDLKLLLGFEAQDARSSDSKGSSKRPKRDIVAV